MTPDLTPTLHMSLLDSAGTQESLHRKIHDILNYSVGTEKRISHSPLGQQGERGRYFILVGAKRTVLGIWGYELELRLEFQNKY